MRFRGHLMRFHRTAVAATGCREMSSNQFRSASLRTSFLADRTATQSVTLCIVARTIRLYVQTCMDLRIKVTLNDHNQ